MTQSESLLDSEYVGLGAAVMLLRGAVERVYNCIPSSNTENILSEIVYAEKVLEIYQKSRSFAPPNSTVTAKYRIQGDVDYDRLQLNVYGARQFLQNRIQIILEE